MFWSCCCITGRLGLHRVKLMLVVKLQCLLDFVCVCQIWSKLQSSSTKYCIYGRCNTHTGSLRMHYMLTQRVWVCRRIIIWQRGFTAVLTQQASQLAERCLTGCVDNQLKCKDQQCVGDAVTGKTQSQCHSCKLHSWCTTYSVALCTFKVLLVSLCGTMLL